MARRPFDTRKLVSVAVVFVTALAVFGLLNRRDAPEAPPDDPVGITIDRTGGSGGERIRRLQAALRTDPADARAYSALAGAYLQAVRETGDPSLYPKADALLRKALRIDRRDISTLVGLGTLALARHDFRGALRWGIMARRSAPELVAPYPVVVDAQVELGRYKQAARDLQRWINLKPGLAAYSRASYVRELHGDLPGAAEAMRLAVSAGGAGPEDVAHVQTLLGDLELMRGRRGVARQSYRTALARLPGYVPAKAGLADVDAARGDLPAAVRRYRDLVAEAPSTELALALGEAELAMGRVGQARRDLELVRVQERLLQRAGENTDTEVALFEANHGDAKRGVAVARRSWSAAPSVRSADALGWALARSGQAVAGLTWARRALKLGTKDPSFLYHAGMSAKAAGRTRLARNYLERALRVNPVFSPLYAPRARRALARLSRDSPD